MDTIKIYEGIIIGTVGGIIIILVNYLRRRYKDGEDMKKVEDWLLRETSDKSSNAIWRSTRAIASYNNLTEDRVDYICSTSKNIVLSTSPNNENKAMWGMKRIVRS